MLAACVPPTGRFAATSPSGGGLVSPFARRLAVVLAGVLVLLCGAAHASKPRCRLEQVVVRDGALTALAGVVQLEGQPDADRPPSTFTLLADGKPLGRGDRALSFERSGTDAYVVLAVEISALFGKSIEKIKEALRDFLDALPPRVKVRLMLFGNEVTDQGSFIPAAAVSLDDIVPDDEGDIQLLNAISQGMRALQNAGKVPPRAVKGDKAPKEGPPPRRVLVLLSDGLSASMERRQFRLLGDQLRTAGVALFPVGFSPRDDRGPLLNLGELAKRSAGTFRWAEKEDNLKDQFQSLAEELKQLQVVHFGGAGVAKLVDDAEDLGRTSFSLRCGDLTSNPYALRGEPAKKERTRWYWWVAGILGVLLALWGLAQGLVFWMRRKVPPVVPAWQPPGVPAAPGMPVAPGMPGVQPSPTGAYPQQPGTGAYPQQPGTGAYPQQPGTGAYPQQPGTGAYPQQPGTGAHPQQGGTGAYAQQPDHGRVVSLDAGRAGGQATLVMIGGPLGGQRVPVTAPVFAIGKGVQGPGTLPVTSDPTVSSRHCELRRDQAGYLLVDLGSTNGTFVNDRRLTGPARLADGDIVRVGSATQFRFRLD